MGSAAPHAINEPLWLRFLDRTSVTVTALTALFLAYTRSAGATYFSAGALACSLTVKVVKRVIRQERPLHSSLKKKVTYGMPSTHSATITYYGVYVPLACAFLPLHSTLPSRLITRWIPPLIVVPWATMIAVSRVWLGHHTWTQVLAGCAYGGAFACLWYWMWISGVNSYGASLEASVNTFIDHHYKF